MFDDQSQTTSMILLRTTRNVSSHCANSGRAAPLQNGVPSSSTHCAPLIKQGNTGALSVVGFAPSTGISAKLQIQPKRVSIGDPVQLHLVLNVSSKREVPVLVDYRVHFIKADGTTSPKVFKWTTSAISRDAPVTLTKQHHMRETTTRTPTARKTCH